MHYVQVHIILMCALYALTKMQQLVATTKNDAIGWNSLGEIDMYDFCLQLLAIQLRYNIKTLFHETPKQLKYSYPLQCSRYTDNLLNRIAKAFYIVIPI